MYCLATVHSVTDRWTYGRTDRQRAKQTDRQHYHADSRSYCVQYDRLKLPHLIMPTRRIA